ncbi:MAG TPA: (Fe-S)-binding protein [Thermodesulfobacteriota bacterium]|nr:(Fe-S)-binding protein [Thermodesulfobacteriota bacterium]
MEVKVLRKEAVDMIKNAGGEAFRLCFQCGLCTASCPWNNVRTFMPHKIITQSKFGLIERGGEDWWLCTTCNLCLSRCPRGVSTTDIMVALRRILVEEGRVPITLRDALEAVFKQGNPWGRARNKRSEWAEGLGIRDFTQGDKADMLLYVGCASSYDPRVQKVSKALVNIFTKAGIDVGILGNEETCCGNEVRRMGEKGLFEMLVEHNLELFHNYGINQIVTISPHCYNAIKNEYQDNKIEVKHYTQFLAELVDTGKLTFSHPFEKVVTYHDPCYLGRHNSLYDEPRQILKRIPGLALVEMLDYRENSLCCGGGGGRMWVETEKEERFSDLRINQAVDAGAKVLATSCPFCMLNLEDSLLTMDKGDELEIKDISEIVQEVTEK